MAQNKTTADSGKNIKHTQASPGSMCSFCRVGDNNELAFGKLYQLGDITIHYYCLLLSSNMDQHGEDDEGVLGFLYPDVLKELKRGNRLVCVYCKRNNATIGCCASRCKKVFHLPCGHAKGSLHQFFGQFKSFCRDHRPTQKIPTKLIQSISSDDVTCPICLDLVDPKSVVSTIWAPCCKKNAWFHRNCVQSLAISAGYFFKCPLCCDKKIFQKAMLDFGIFIPEQDASWERVPDAFQELLQRPNQCDAPECKCPKGRNMNEKGTRFELVMCNLCGGQASHIYCSHLQWSNPQYACETCYKWADSPHHLSGGDDADEESEQDEKDTEDNENNSNEERITLEKAADTDVNVDIENEDDEWEPENKETVQVTPPTQSQPLSPVRQSEGPSHRIDMIPEVPKVEHKDLPPVVPTPAVEELIILSDSDDDEVEVIEPPDIVRGELLAADGSKIPVLRFSIPLNPPAEMHIEGDVKIRTEVIDVETNDDDVTFEGFTPGVPGFENRDVSVRPIKKTTFDSSPTRSQPVEYVSSIAPRSRDQTSESWTQRVESTKQTPPGMHPQTANTSPQISRTQTSNQLSQKSPQSSRVSLAQNQYSSASSSPVSSRLPRSSLQQQSAHKTDPRQTGMLAQQHQTQQHQSRSLQRINSVSQQSSQQTITSRGEKFMPQGMVQHSSQRVVQQSPQRMMSPQNGQPLHQQIHNQPVPRRRLPSGRAIRQQLINQQMAQNTAQQMMARQAEKSRSVNQAGARQFQNNVSQMQTPSGQCTGNVSLTPQEITTIVRENKLPSQQHNVPNNNRRRNQSKHQSPAAAVGSLGQNSQQVSPQQLDRIPTNVYSHKQQVYDECGQPVQQVVDNSAQESSFVQQGVVGGYPVQGNLDHAQPSKKACYSVPRTDIQENQAVFTNAVNYIEYTNKPPPSYEEAVQYEYVPGNSQSLVAYPDGQYLTDNGGAAQQGVVAVPTYSSPVDSSGAPHNLITVQNYNPDPSGQGMVTYSQGYVPEGVSPKQNVLVHSNMGTLVTVNSTPQTQFYLSTQPHGPAVIQNYINTMPQQQYMDGTYSSTSGHGRVQRPDHCPSTTAVAPSSSAIGPGYATCDGPYIGAEAPVPAYQTKSGSGYPRLREEPVGGIVLEILGPSHVNVHVSGKFLGNLKLTYPSVVTNDPRIVNAAKAAYKRSMSWGQHKSRGSYKKQKRKDKAYPTGNQLGLHSDRHIIHASKGEGSQKGNVRSSESNSQQNHSETSSRKPQQSSVYASNGHSQWSRSRSSSSDSQQDDPWRFREVNDSQCGRSRRSSNSSVNSERNHSRSSSRSSRSLSKDLQPNCLQGLDRNSQVNISQSLSKDSVLNHTSSSTSRVGNGLKRTLSKESLMHCKRDSEDSVRLDAEQRKSTGRKRKRYWHRGVVKSKKKYVKSKSKSCVKETQNMPVLQEMDSNTTSKHSPQITMPVLDKESNTNTTSKNSLNKHTTSNGTLLKRTQRTSVSGDFSVDSTSPRTRSKLSSNTTLTRSKMSLKHFTFKMGAKNSLNEQPRTVSKKNVQYTTCVSTSLNPSDQATPRMLKENSIYQLCSYDQSARNVDVEMTDLCSDSGNSDDSSSDSCKTTQSVEMSSTVMERSMSMDALYSHDGFKLHSSNTHFFGSGNRASCVDISTSEMTQSHFRNSNEVDDSSHSDSDDIAFPVFCRQRLYDNLAKNSDGPKMIIKFKAVPSDSSSEISSIEETSSLGSVPSLSLNNFQSKFKKNDSIESKVCGQAGHVSRRDQVNHLSEANCTKNKSSPQSGKSKDLSIPPIKISSKCITTRSRTANDVIRTRSRSRSISRRFSITEFSLDSLKSKTKKQSLKKTRTLSAPCLRRSVSLSGLEMISDSTLNQSKKCESISNLTVRTHTGKPQSLNNNSKTGHSYRKRRSKAAVTYIETRSRSLKGTRSRSQSLSCLNKSSLNDISQQVNRSKHHSAKNVSLRKTAKIPHSRKCRSSSLSRVETSSKHGVDTSNYTFLRNKISSSCIQHNSPVRMSCKHSFQECSLREMRTRTKSSHFVETCSKSMPFSDSFHQNPSSLLTKPLLQKPGKRPPLRNTLRRSKSFSNIETSVMCGFVHESDQESLSDASSATSSRVASLKAGALTARKFRPPSQREIEQRRLLQNLQWYSNFQ